MQSDVKQVFYFHADATSVGGYIEEPFRYVPTPSSVALPSTGGSSTNEARHFGFEDSVKVRAAYTHVSGRPTQKNGPWTQRVVSVIEGLSVLGRFTAERLVAQMFVEQPAAGGGPRKISFAGTTFTDLRVDGAAVIPTFNTALVPPNERRVDAYNREETHSPELEWPSLREIARRQGVERLDIKGLPDWARARFGWTAKDGSDVNSNEGYTLCSLVNQIDGLKSGQSFGHAIELPDFGRIFLAEATILPYSAHLTMFRAELGCKVTGQVSAATIQSNGTTMPPN
jgi:hypothetical protein